MKVRAPLTLIFILLSCNYSQAQTWSGVISASRATDWSVAGVVGGIPSRTTICTTLGAAGHASTFAQSTTASQISSAVGSCTPGQTVLLNPGTYTINGIRVGSNSVTLRGSGASQTIMVMTGIAPEGCTIGDGQTFGVCANGANIASSPGPDNSATWNCDDTAGTCAQNRTAITLSSHTNLTVGSTIWLDQNDDASDGYPSAGDVWISNWGGGESYARSSRGLVEGHIVSSCGTSSPGAACTSNSIVLATGLHASVWRSERTPGAWWGGTGTILHDTGIENLTIDLGNSASPSSGLYFINCTNCWAKGLRLLSRATVTSGQPRMMNVINGEHISIVDNYFYGYFASSLVSIYTLAPHIMSESLIQNNIFHATTNPLVLNSTSWGNVVSYNYWNSDGINASFAQSSIILHGVTGLNLSEGNDGKNYSCDNIHSSHSFETLFRNHWSGQANTSSGTETQAAQTLYAACRFFNIVGDVSGNSSWSQYSVTGSGSCGNGNIQNAIFFLGWQGSNSTGCAATGNDSNVSRTLMRWGGWDSVSSSNDNSTNDSTGTRFVNAEVPSGITNFPNSIPGNQILPSSFYLSSLPSTWWNTPYGQPAWPATGPDVTSGNINNGSTEPTGGHANKIPARLCFENASNDTTNYNGSSPAIKTFDSSTCYITAAQQAQPLSGPARLRLHP